MDNKMKKRPHDMAWRGSHMESKNMRGQEIPEKRAHNGKVFDLGGGAYQYVQYPETVHFQDAQGRWQEIDNRLVEQKNREGIPVLRNRQNQIAFEFAKQTQEGALISIRGKGGHRLSWTLQGQREGIPANVSNHMVRAEADEDEKRADLSKVETSLSYEEILPGMDLVCHLQSMTFKDEMILKNPQAPHTIQLNLMPEDVDLVLEQDGTILALDSKKARHKQDAQADRQQVFAMPAAFMRDNEGRIGEVKTELIHDGNQARMILTCDEAFLEQASYPIVIDPLVQTVQHSSTMEDNYVTSKSPNTVQSYSQARLRVCKNTSYGECRSFLKFTELPFFMPSNMVTKAYLRMELYADSPTQAVPVYLKEVLEDWSSRTITWNNQPAISDMDTDVVIIPASVGTGSQFAFDISNLVRKWYQGENYGVAFERKITSTPNTIDFGSSDSVYHKPVVMINYVSFAGLQSHLAYDTMDCASSGSAHVNLYNGDLVIECPLTRCGGNRMPVSLTAYFGYSSYDSFSRMGSNWRLSCDQSIYKDNINDELHFIWCRGDGSRIYFKKPNSSSSVYEDLSGLSLKLTDGAYTEIEDKQGTVMRFESPVYVGDDTGRILSITDACGNTNTFQYSGWYISSVTDGAGRVTTINRDENNYISEIYAPGESEPIRFNYDGFKLWMISRPNSGSVEFSYDENGMMYEMLDTEAWKLLYFVYENAEPHRIWNMYEMAWPDEDQIPGKDHGYSYSDMMTTVTDYTSNGSLKHLYYQFNDFGNLVCVRDDLGYASYSKFSEELLPNHPEQVSKLQRSVINLLPNHDFELDGYWSTALNGGEGSFAYVTDQKYLGSRSMRMAKTNADGNLCVYMSYSNLEIGKAYTLSGYIRSSGNVQGYATVQHQNNWFNSELLTPGSEWTRVAVSFTAASTSATLYFVTTGTGTLWVDCAQLEVGSVPNRYNLLRNCDFSLNSSGVPTFWTANGSNTSGDAIVTSADDLHPSFLTNNRMRLYGDPQTNKGIYQDLPVSGSQGDVFVVGGWAKGYSRPIANEPRRFAIRLAFKNSSGTFVNSDILSWNEEWTDWQYISGAVIAPCAYTAIRYNVDYEKNVNYADFDGLTLYKEEFGNTFAYDEDGNVTAVKNLASKQAKAEYDDYNNLISYVQPGRPDSVKTTIGYGNTEAEKKMRLPRRTTTPTNIRTNNLYDDHGNLTQSTVIDIMDGTCAIVTGQSHTSDGNHVATKTDARGKVVTYTTDLAKDTLTRVTDPNGQSVNYTYDALKRVTGTSATVDGNTYKNTYTYEDDRLKTVAHNTTGDTPDVTYTFDYDEFGNPTTVKVGTQTLSTNVYTTTGDRTLTRVEYGNGGKVHYTRDDFRRVTGIHYDDATEPRFTYDYGANGQAAYVKDAELGRTVWTEYDTSERPIRTHLMEDVTGTSTGTPKYTSTLGYDEFGNVASFKEKVNNNASYETTYAYNIENQPTQLRFGTDNRKLTYTYDPIGRLYNRVAVGAANYTTQYAYFGPDPEDTILTTPLVTSITQNGQNFSYTYDNVGNIASETRNGLTTTYVYDNLGQLTRVNDPHANKSTMYLYDRGGNLTGYLSAPYTLAPSIDGATEMVFYSYDDANWKDKVTAIGGKAITYDAIGNPLTYDGWTFTWKTGRMLASMVKTGTNAQFTYDHNGLRVKKVVNGVTTNYTLNGKNIVHVTQGSNDLHFFYDAQNKPAMVRFNGTDYFYIYNLQGDVVAMIDANGTQVVEYHYDAWGAPVAKTGSMAATLGTVNPFRYRGYVYDEETGLYYLRSRYYNPVWKRCINSDSNLNSGYIVFSSNQFCYCLNNPIAGVDINGYNVSFGYYHNKVQDDFINNNPEVRKEVGFYKYGDSGKKGRADLVNFGTGDVWEVKPQMSGYLRNPLTYTDRALRQLQSYIEGVFSNDQNRVMLRGKNLHPGHAVQKRSFYDAQTDTDVGYWSMGDGIIWYKTTKRQHLEASRVTALDPQKEESPSYSLQPNGLVLGVLTIVYALAQSVFPPIPGFAF